MPCQTHHGSGTGCCLVDRRCDAGAPARPAQAQDADAPGPQPARQTTAQEHKPIGTWRSIPRVGCHGRVGATHASPVRGQRRSRREEVCAEDEDRTARGDRARARAKRRRWLARRRHVPPAPRARAQYSATHRRRLTADLPTHGTTRTGLAEDQAVGWCPAVRDMAPRSAPVCRDDDSRARTSTRRWRRPPRVQRGPSRATRQRRVSATRSS